MKYLTVLILVSFMASTVSAQKAKIGLGINYNNGVFSATSKRLLLYDSGYTAASIKPSMGISLNAEKRLSPKIIFDSYVNLLFKTPRLSKPKVTQPQGGTVEEYAYLRFFSVELGGKVFFSPEFWKLKLYPFAGLNISINQYTGMELGASASASAGTAAIATFKGLNDADFTELYPATVSVGGLLGASYRFKLWERKADVFVMANFALTNPFSKSIGTDKNNRAMYIDGTFTLYSVGMNIFLKKDKEQ